jgi:hypothetical protein
MSQTQPMQEDSFEKARAAFFGKVRVESKPSAPQAGAMTPSNETVRETAAQTTTAMATS